MTLAGTVSPAEEHTLPPILFAYATRMTLLKVYCILDSE